MYSMSTKVKGAVRASLPRHCVVARAAAVSAPEKVSTTDGPVLGRDYHAPHVIPDEAIPRIVNYLKKGTLFRYGGPDEGSMQVSYTESEFAAYTGHKYCVAFNSCGSAIFAALWAAGVKEGDIVLSNALTFNAVPSAIYHARATGVLIESEPDHTMDLLDMEKKIKENPTAKYMLVSHMRGKLCDMDKVKELCDKAGIIIIEDCAHSVGVFWGDKHTGHHAIAACFSTQAHKAINSGEGGFLCTDDAEIAAKVIVLAGGYEKMYLSHLTCPGPEVFEAIEPLNIPNFSIRMSSLTAAAIRPQIPDLPRRIERANETFARVSAALLRGAEEVGANVAITKQHPKVRQHKDSIQFELRGYSWEQVQTYLADVKRRGVPVAVFGPPNGGLARDFRSWRYLYENGEPPAMPKTEKIIQHTIDLRLPPRFTDEEFDRVAACLVAGFGACGPPAYAQEQSEEVQG